MRHWLGIAVRTDDSARHKIWIWIGIPYEAGADFATHDPDPAPGGPQRPSVPVLQSVRVDLPANLHALQLPYNVDDGKDRFLLACVARSDHDGAS